MFITEQRVAIMCEFYKFLTDGGGVNLLTFIFMTSVTIHFTT